MIAYVKHYWATWAHRLWVNWYILTFGARLWWRGQTHDLSKYGPYEASVYARVLPRLRAAEPEEYEEAVDDLGRALKHHYAANSHHPEHYEHGVRQMDLWELVEMWCDWRAAVRGHSGRDLIESIRKAQDRYELDQQLVHLFVNTAVELDGTSATRRRSTEREEA